MVSETYCSVKYGSSCSATLEKNVCMEVWVSTPSPQTTNTPLLEADIAE